MMALRHRLTLLAAGTVGITVVLVSIAAFFVLRHELRSQVDDALAEQYAQVATRLEQSGFAPGVPLPGSPFRGGAPSGPVQLLGADGSIFARSTGDLPVPVDADDRAIAAGRRRYLVRDTHAAGLHLRVLTAAVAGGGAIQITRSLANVDSTLSRLRIVLALLCLAGTLLA